jgi:hypothetical protein
MSWNVSTRLNNLQQQINNIANKGLTNPLEQILDANGYTINNVNVIDGGSNAIEFKTDNIGGIKMDNSLNVDANITCNTLNYTSLNPPINTNGISFQLLGSNVTESSAGNFVFTQYNPYNGFLTTTKILNPSASMEINFNQASSSNTYVIGFSTSNALYPNGGFRSIQSGIYWYPQIGQITQLVNSVQTSNTYEYENQTDISLLLKIIDGELKIYINNIEATVLNQPLEGLFYFGATVYTGVTTTSTLSNLVVGQTVNETLSQVLQNGNDAGGLNISNAGSITGTDINMTDNIYCDGFLEIGNKVSNSSQLHLFYGDGTSSGNNFQVVGSTGDNFSIKQYKSDSLYNQPLLINDKNYIQLGSQLLLFTKDNNITNSYILDSFNNTPIYKQFYNDISGNNSSAINSPSSLLLFSVPSYPSTSNTLYNYGLNNVDITFTTLLLTFTTLSTISPSPNFSINQNATIFLSDSIGNYNPSESNNITINLVSAAGQATNRVVFKSTVPIILWNCTSTNKNKIYLNVNINGIPPIGVINYNVSMTSSDFMVNSYISKTQGGTIVFGQ